MKRGSLVLSSLSVVALLGTGVMSAQESSGGASSATGTGGSVFRSAVDLVALNVVVTDTAQRFVSGLTSRDFTILEDGVPQELAFFATSDVPLDLAILLDTSASMTDKMAVVRQAAKGFVATVRPADRVMVVDIKDATRILYPLGDDVAAATAAVGNTKPGGGTGLYNGLYLTIKELSKAQRARPDEVRRQAIVVLSDGRDTASLVSFDDVLDVAKGSGIAMYTITLRTQLGTISPASLSRATVESEYSMKRLAEETGARPFFPAHINELDGVYASIATELANQYALAYTPTNTRLDGTFRRIAVQVLDRPGVRTRTRSGYTPNRPFRAGT